MKLSAEMITEQVKRNGRQGDRSLEDLVKGEGTGSWDDFLQAAAGSDEMLTRLLVPLISVMLFSDAVKLLGEESKKGTPMPTLLRSSNMTPITESFLRIAFLGYQIGRAQVEVESLERMVNPK